MPFAQLFSGVRHRRPGLWLALALLAACTVARQLPPPRPYESTCAPGRPVVEPVGLHRLPADQAAADSLLARIFTPKGVRTANACGLVPRLQALGRIRQGSVARQLLARRLGQQLAGVTQAVQQTRLELECEQHRAADLAAVLQANATRRRYQQLLLALGLGLAGLGLPLTLMALAASPFSVRATGVVCLLAAAATAWGATHARAPEVNFAHPRNALGEIRRGPPASSLFPPTVWAYLSQPGVGPRPASPREQLRQRWRRLGSPTVGGTAQLSRLLFEQGGLYQPEQLRIRARLLGELAAQVRVLEQQLHALATTVTRIA